MVLKYRVHIKIFFLTLTFYFKNYSTADNIILNRTTFCNLLFNCSHYFTE